jgi:hypothetical protein
MNIGFTGHRDCHTTEAELDKIANLYHGALWVHGGALGFDTQVDEYAKAHKIGYYTIRPDYQTYAPHVAPIMRNYQIVNFVDLLVVCWDARQSGGTYRTQRYARSKGKPIIMVACISLPKKEQSK